MSQKELQRVKVIENAAGGRLSVREASRLLHLSERQVQRLQQETLWYSVYVIALWLVVAAVAARQSMRLTRDGSYC